MIKVVLAGHVSESGTFVSELQKKSLIHLKRFSSESASGFSETVFPEDIPAVSRVISELEEMDRFLERYGRKQSPLKKLLTPPRSMKRDEYEKLAAAESPETLIKSFNELKSSLESLKTEGEKLEQKNNHLSLWKNITFPLSETGDRPGFKVVLGTVPVIKTGELVRSGLADFEILETVGNRAIVLIAFNRFNDAVEEDVENALSLAGFSPCPLPPSVEPPSERFMKNRERIDQIRAEWIELNKKTAGLEENRDRLLVFLRHFKTLALKSRVFDSWMRTENTFIITGWIRERDLKTLETLAESFSTVSMEVCEPDRGERPPAAFSNPALFSPFQLITRMYGFPGKGSLDPSPVLSIFFALFFGITLTDAGYGLILVALSLTGLCLKKFDGARDILWIVFWGGLFTVIAGILTGGIFGDLLRTDDPFIPAARLGALREKAMWFDPLKEPMVFFRFVLLLGVVHIALGLILGIFTDLKEKRYGDALVERGAWLVMMISLLTVLFSNRACIDMALIRSSEPPVPALFSNPALCTAGFSAAVIVLFGARNEKNLFFRLFIGVLKLFVLSGLFSYIGDILSYIRLMALGMVTAGIGMAVNAIAFLMKDIPGIGTVLTVAVLFAGHLMNLSINLLGGFVHSLRLNYVEFFPKFFDGSGEPFEPFSENRNDLEIIE
jgi:V/A-type H+-transporting ATPase subunit I